MKLLFITDNFPPEVNAPATRTYEHCQIWVNEGVEVTVLTCFPNFPQGKIYKGYKNKLFQVEHCEGIKVIRVWSYIAANKGTIKRTLDYFSFAITSFLMGLFLKTDIIIATSPQFFSAASGRWLSFFKHKPWLMEVRDLWPESIKNLGMMKSDFMYSFFEWWEKRLYRTALKIIVVTETFKTDIINKGISPNKIEVVKNGANLDLFHPMIKNQALIKKLGLEDKFIISYIGTHGMAHKLDFILKCAAAIKDQKFHFLFIGDGAEKTNLIHLKDKLGLINVTMLDSITKDKVPTYLSISDVSLIPLKKSELFKSVIPSKIFETSAMQIPILLGVEGESCEMVKHYCAGLTFEPENQDDFIRQLNKIASNKTINQACKEGCKKLASDFDRKVLAKKMLHIIENY